MVAAKNNTIANPALKEKHLGEKREKLFKSLPQECQTLIGKVKDLFARGDKASLEQRYELGTTIRDLLKELSKGKDSTYGLNLIGKLCDLHGWERGIVYGALAVVGAFPQDLFTSICSRPFPNGRLITFGHLRVLAKLKRQSTRMALLEKTLANGWTRAELDSEVIKHSKEKSKEDGRGRPHKEPKDLPTLLRQQEQIARQFVARAGIWEKPETSLREQVKKLPQTQITEEQLQILKDHAAMLRELIEKAKKELEETDRAIEDLQKKMETMQSPEPVGDTEAAEEPQPSIEQSEDAKPHPFREDKEEVKSEQLVGDNDSAKLQPITEEMEAAKSHPSIDKEAAKPHPSDEDKEAAISQQPVAEKEAAKPKRRQAPAK